MRVNFKNLLVFSRDKNFVFSVNCTKLKISFDKNLKIILETF